LQKKLRLKKWKCSPRREVAGVVRQPADLLLELLRKKLLLQTLRQQKRMVERP
jgi:hypothetical protein